MEFSSRNSHLRVPKKSSISVTEISLKEHSCRQYTVSVLSQMEMETVLAEFRTESEDIERYIGLRNVFNDPYHLYLRLSDVTEYSPVVKFIVFSMGKRKVIMLGTYHRDLAEGSRFRVMYGCRYSVRDLHKYLSTWSKKFVNAINVVKNRIAERAAAIIGIETYQYIQNRSEYLQLKAWLSMHPKSKYFNPSLDKRVLKDIVTPEYIKKLRSKQHSLSAIDKLKAKLREADLIGDVEEMVRIGEDIIYLSDIAIKEIDKVLGNYENELNIREKHSDIKYALDISEEFYEWISLSEYNSISWIGSLKECGCTWDGEPTCIVVKWGEEMSLV